MGVSGHLVTYGDCIDLMYKARHSLKRGEPFENQQYDVIDIDPYGSAVPFMNPALEAVSKNGLLSVTCTDLRVLSGRESHKTFYSYGTSKAAVKCHAENSLRIVLNSLNSTANKLGKIIKPLISYKSEFYVRVFIQVEKSLQHCAASLEKVGDVKTP